LRAKPTPVFKPGAASVADPHRAGVSLKTYNLVAFLCCDPTPQTPKDFAVLPINAKIKEPTLHLHSCAVIEAIFTGLQGWS